MGLNTGEPRLAYQEVNPGECGKAQQPENLMSCDRRDHVHQEGAVREGTGGNASPTETAVGLR